MKKVEYVADGWAILAENYGGAHWLMMETNHPTRTQAIEMFVNWWNKGRLPADCIKWGSISKQGYRCIRVYRKVSK